MVHRYGYEYSRCSEYCDWFIDKQAIFTPMKSLSKARYHPAEG